MIVNERKPEWKRESLRSALHSGKLLQFPGAYNALIVLLIEEMKFDGVYISGGVMSNSLGLADVGLTTLSEVSETASRIARTTSLPSIMDIDTGFGEPLNVIRTIKEIEYLGVSGCHLEDQMNPKRCGHLDNKSLVSVAEMTKKIKAAESAKVDSNFILIARTDARAVEGLESAIARAKAYVDAGADVIFPEALQNEGEFEAFRKALQVPILANMTEFGKSPLLDKKTLESLGVNMVIYPVSTQRLALYNVELGLQHLQEHGSLQDYTNRMQTRQRLYDLLRYEDYNQIDNSIYNFSLE